MPVSIIANLASQYAQSAIRTRSDRVASDTLAISSGSKGVGSVADAASMAVGAGLKIDNAGLGSARINASAGVSMLQIADGALSNAGDILVRMQALAVQASTGNLSDAARQPIDQEFQQLKAELGRLAASTNFNGVGLLNGQPSYIITQGSSRAADGVSGVSFNPDGLSGSPVVRYSYDAATEQMTLTRVDSGSASSQVLDLTAIMDSTAGVGHNLTNGQTLQLNFQAIGLTLTLGTAFDRGADIQPVLTDNSGVDIGVTTGAFVPAASGLDTAGVAGLVALSSGYDTTTGDLTLPINTNGATVTLGPLAGVSFDVNGGGVGASGAASADLAPGAAGFVDVYVDTAGVPQKIGRITYADITTAGNTDGSLVINAGRGLLGCDLQTTSSNTILNYKVGTGVVNGQDILQVSLPSIDVASLGLTSRAVDTQGHSNTAIDSLKIALATLSNARATVGAQQSRLSQVINYVDVYKVNNESARSSLTDVDVPAAITDLANNQAMLQAGVAMLSQSNQIPGMLLDMLKNA